MSVAFPPIKRSFSLPETSEKENSRLGVQQEESAVKKPRPTVVAPRLENLYSDEPFARDTSLVNERRPLRKSKIIRTNDDVHHTIHLEPVLAELIDTPHMQRLRDLKQLGTSQHAFVNCNHSRFEHSLGVCHLTQELCRNLRHKQPLLQDPIHGLTPKDALCVAIAALLHDLGHGPFSHTYERFLKELAQQQPSQAGDAYNDCPYPLTQGWKHETMTLQLIDELLLSLGLAIDPDRLDEPLKQVGAHGADPLTLRIHDDSDTLTPRQATLTSRDWIFVKEAIWGQPLPAFGQYVGRPWECKQYLYRIVSNDVLDVDRLDYMSRDERRARNDTNPPYRILEEALVAPTDQGLALVFPDKMAPAIMREVCLRRQDNHHYMYKHKTVECANLMICDIFRLADPYFRLAVRQGDQIVRLPPSRAMHCSAVYLELRDEALLALIKHAAVTDKRLQPAKELIDRYQSRDFYKLAAEKVLDVQAFPDDQALWELGSQRVKQGLLQVADQVFDVRDPTDGTTRLTLTAEEFWVEFTTMHCGMKEENPVAHVYFVDGNGEAAARKAKTFDELPLAMRSIKKLTMIPTAFESKCIRVFVRDAKKRELAEHVFEQFVTGRSDGMTIVDATPLSPIQISQASPFVNKRDAEDTRHRQSTESCMSNSRLFEMVTGRPAS